MILKSKYDLSKEFEESKERMGILENKLNHCSQDEVDELIYELKAEQIRFGRIKRELTEDYQKRLIYTRSE